MALGEAFGGILRLSFVDWCKCILADCLLLMLYYNPRDTSSTRSLAEDLPFHLGKAEIVKIMSRLTY